MSRKNEHCSEDFNTHLLCCQWHRWENVHFSTKPMHVTTQIDWSCKNNHCSEGFNTHIWGISGERWENVHFLSKPRHVTPHIHHLRKTRSVLRLSTHIYGVSKDIGGGTFIFQLNLCMWALKSVVSKKTSPVLRVSTHIYGVSQEIDWKTCSFLE